MKSIMINLATQQFVGAICSHSKYFVHAVTSAPGTRLSTIHEQQPQQLLMLDQYINKPPVFGINHYLFRVKWKWLILIWIYHYNKNNSSGIPLEPLVFVRIGGISTSESAWQVGLCTAIYRKICCVLCLLHVAHFFVNQCCNYLHRCRFSTRIHFNFLCRNLSFATDPDCARDSSKLPREGAAGV